MARGIKEVSEKGNQSEQPKKVTLAQKEQVRDMFNSIAPKYDFLNHFLSAGIDIHWRKKVIRNIKKHPHKTILDVATGTGDLAIAAAKLKPESIIGVDISVEMLRYQKMKLNKKKLNKLISLQQADGESLPFEDNTFDVVMIAFGIRNFENLQIGLSEMRRVLKKGGLLTILEFSKPEKWPVKQFYNFYFRHVLPRIGKLVSKSSEAYTYLPDSVGHFPSGKKFTQYLTEAGFEDTSHNALTFGIASIYNGRK